MSLKRSIAEALAGALGLHVLPRIDAWSWPEDYFWRALFDALKPDCVFDVGANHGQYGRWLRKQGYRGVILSFEPAPAVFQSLAQAVAGDARWHAHRYAFGAESGTLPFNEMQGSDFSSFLSPSGDHGLPFRDANVVDRVTEVEVKTIAETYDALAAEHGFSRPFLKMDTQGYDLNVVRGAGAHLDRFVAMLSEVPRQRLYEGSPTMTESVDELANRGFDLARMFPVHPEVVLNTVEFNAYFINRRLARMS